MGVDVLHGRMYCTVADVPFGPQCLDDDEAWALKGHIWRTRGCDPRALSLADGAQEQALAELRDGSSKTMPNHPDVVCFCGSGELREALYYKAGRQFSQCSACKHRVKGWSGWAEGPPR